MHRLTLGETLIPETLRQGQTQHSFSYLSAGLGQINCIAHSSKTEVFH